MRPTPHRGAVMTNAGSRLAALLVGSLLGNCGVVAGCHLSVPPPRHPASNNVELWANTNTHAHTNTGVYDHMWLRCAQELQRVVCFYFYQTVFLNPTSLEFKHIVVFAFIFS